MRCLVSLLALCALVTLCAPAAADDKDDCFNAAEKAQKLRNEKKLTLARPQLITCARDICPQQVRTDCVKWLGEVDGAMSTVVVRARDIDGHDVIEVKVFVDDQLFLPKLQGTATTIDPGQHKFRYEFPNGKTQEEDVLIAEGEKDRVIRVELKGDLGGSGSSGSSGGDSGAKSGGPGPIPWIIGGVGLASLIGFAIIEIPIQSQYSDLQNGCAKTGAGCTSDQKNSVTSLYAPAAVLLGVGIAGIGVGATWLIVSALTHPSNKTGSSSSFGITPLAGGGGFASFSRAF